MKYPIFEDNFNNKIKNIKDIKYSIDFSVLDENPYAEDNNHNSSTNNNPNLINENSIDYNKIVLKETILEDAINKNKLIRKSSQLLGADEMKSLTQSTNASTIFSGTENNNDYLHLRRLPKINEKEYQKLKNKYFTTEEDYQDFTYVLGKLKCEYNEINFRNPIGCILPLEYLIERTYGFNPKYKNEMLKKYNILKNHIVNYRTIGGDGNCYYRAVMFRYIELLIINKQIDWLKSIISDMDNCFKIKELKNLLYFKNQSLKEEYTIKVLMVIVDLLEEDKILQAHNLFFRSILRCYKIDYVLILYLRFILYLYIKENEKKLYLESFPILIGNLLPIEYEKDGIFDFKRFYKKFLLSMFVYAEKIIIYLTPFVLGVNLGVVLFEDNEDEVVKNFKFSSIDKNNFKLKNNILLMNNHNHYEVIYNEEDNINGNNIFNCYKKYPTSIIRNLYLNNGVNPNISNKNINIEKGDKNINNKVNNIKDDNRLLVNNFIKAKNETPIGNNFNNNYYLNSNINYNNNNINYNNNNNYNNIYNYNINNNVNYNNNNNNNNEANNNKYINNYNQYYTNQINTNNKNDNTNPNNINDYNNITPEYYDVSVKNNHYNICNINQNTNQKNKYQFQNYSPNEEAQSQYSKIYQYNYNTEKARKNINYFPMNDINKFNLQNYINNNDKSRKNAISSEKNNSVNKTQNCNNVKYPDYSSFRMYQINNNQTSQNNNNLFALNSNNKLNNKNQICKNCQKIIYKSNNRLCKECFKKEIIIQSLPFYIKYFESNNKNKNKTSKKDFENLFLSKIRLFIDNKNFNIYSAINNIIGENNDERKNFMNEIIEALKNKICIECLKKIKNEEFKLPCGCHFCCKEDMKKFFDSNEIMSYDYKCLCSYQYSVHEVYKLVMLFDKYGLFHERKFLIKYLNNIFNGKCCCCGLVKENIFQIKILNDADNFFNHYICKTCKIDGNNCLKCSICYKIHKYSLFSSQYIEC